MTKSRRSHNKGKNIPIIILGRALGLLKGIDKKHFFPLLIIGIASTLSFLGISGSSIEIYNYVIGNNIKDSNLLYGESRGIRADEWLIITSKSIAQEYNDLREYNPAIGPDGENLAVTPDIPTDNINSFFRPQNAGFFFLGLEQAIAFKWWFFISSAIISAYYFSLQFFTKKIYYSTLLSLFLAYAPLTQWTYREFIFLPLTFGLMSIMVAYKLYERNLNYKNKVIVKDKQNKSELLVNVFLTVLLAYCLVAYLLVLYPPTQIVVFIVLGLFYIDLVIKRLDKRKLSEINAKKIFKSHKFVMAGLSLAAIVFTLLMIQQQNVVGSIVNTEHPGVRSFESGAMVPDFERFRNLWIGGAVPTILLNEDALANTQYFDATNTTNQSEASNYVWVLPILLILVLLQNRYFKHTYNFYFLIIALLVVMIYMLLPGLNLPLLNQVQPNRWNLAVGLLSFLSLGVLYLRWSKQKNAGLKIPPGYKFIASVAFLIFTTVSIIMLKSLAGDVPSAVGKDEYLAFAITMAAISLLFFNKFGLALTLLVAVNLYAGLQVNPLYRGVSAATENKLVNTIEYINNQDGGNGLWYFAGNDPAYEMIPLLAGANSFTTHFSYPQDFWNYFDPEGDEDFVYNRAAHTSAGLTDGATRIYLKEINIIGVVLNPCRSIQLVEQLGIKYIVTLERSISGTMQCLHQETVVETNSKEFTIYSINNVK